MPVWPLSWFGLLYPYALYVRFRKRFALRVIDDEFRGGRSPFRARDYKNRNLFDRVVP